MLIDKKPSSSNGDFWHGDSKQSFIFRLLFMHNYIQCLIAELGMTASIHALRGVG